MEKTIRLDRFLSEMGIATRSQIREMIRKKRIRVNGIVAAAGDAKINPMQDQVMVDENSVTYEKTVYYMLNKPSGVITATRDSRHSTVLDLIREPLRTDVFPVGRLDRDTEGLLLLTNDGKLAHELLSPRKHVAKQYEALVSGHIGEREIAAFRAGIVCEDGTLFFPATLRVLGTVEDEDGTLTRVQVVIFEGKYHQVKRMFEAVGARVKRLKRISMGWLCLDPELKPGEYRRLTEWERMLLSKRAVVFDLDGTLIDSMGMWHEIDIEYLGRYGYQVPEGLQRVIEGMSFVETAQYFKAHFQIPQTVEEMRGEWNEMARSYYASRVRLKPGAMELLLRLRELDWKIGIATSNSRELVHAFLDANQLGGYFDAVVTGTEVINGKPAPDIYLRAAQLMGVPPEECLVFEDVPMGIRAGKAAGMTTAAIYDSASDEVWAEKQALADFSVMSFLECLPPEATTGRGKTETS